MRDILQDIIYKKEDNKYNIKVKYKNIEQSNGCLTKAIFFIARFAGWQMHAICYKGEPKRASH